MIRVCCSNRTEALLQAFVRNMQRERESAGPFAPVRVVVPNRNVETYLRLGVARACGIAANLQVTFLRKLLGHVAEQALPNGRVVDAQQIQAHLLALFHDVGFLQRPEMAPVRDYLRAGGEAHDAVDRRRCQLAFRLGPLFEEYAASRADMVKRWETGTTLDDDHLFAATEVWQRAPRRWASFPPTSWAPPCTSSAPRMWRRPTIACSACWLAISTCTCTR